MRDNFERSLGFVLQFEGGYSDHPSDPGGATNLGITIENLRLWRKREVSKKEVRELTVADVEPIYRDNYWDACRCDDLPSGIDFAVFDCAVNQGVGRAARFLQQASGAIVQGGIGPQTLGKVKEADQEELLIEFMARRMQGYATLVKLFRVFGLGWSRRLVQAHTIAVSLLK